MVCANDGEASVVGSSPQGAKPNSMKEEHIVIIVMLWEERIRGDKSKALGDISIPTGPDLMGSAISNELPGFQAICMKGEPWNVMMFPVKCARPRLGGGALSLGSLFD